MLTFFTLPKPFTDPRTATAQDNAIASWKQALPDAEVILFGDEAGIAEAAARHGVIHEPSVPRNDFGTPLLDHAFLRAQSRARHALVAYANTDIIFTRDLGPALATLTRSLRARFLLVGRRTNLNLTEPLPFDAPDWERRLRERAAGEGELFAPWAIDYFIFPRGQVASMPPFPVGRAGWDNWMIHDARSRGIPVVDAGGMVLAVHQNHDYGHLAGGEAAALRGVETERNWKMLGPDFYPMSIVDATFVLRPGGAVPAYDARHLLRRLMLWPALSPRLKVSVRIARRVKRLLMPSRVMH